MWPQGHMKTMFDITAAYAIRIVEFYYVYTKPFIKKLNVTNKKVIIRRKTTFTKIVLKRLNFSLFFPVIFATSLIAKIMIVFIVNNRRKIAHSL